MGFFTQTSTLFFKGYQKKNLVMMENIRVFRQSHSCFCFLLPSSWRSRCCRTNGANMSASVATPPDWRSECLASPSSWARRSRCLAYRKPTLSLRLASRFLRRNCSFWLGTTLLLKDYTTQQIPWLKRQTYLQHLSFQTPPPQVSPLHPPLPNLGLVGLLVVSQLVLLPILGPLPYPQVIQPLLHPPLLVLLPFLTRQVHWCLPQRLPILLLILGKARILLGEFCSLGNDQWPAAAQGKNCVHLDRSLTMVLSYRSVVPFVSIHKNSCNVLIIITWL